MGPAPEVIVLTALPPPKHAKAEFYMENQCAADKDRVDEMVEGSLLQFLSIHA